MSAVSPAGIELLAEVQGLLFRESRLLDEHAFDDWLALYDAECEYILPILEGSDREPAIIRDSRGGMEERIFRLTSTLAHAQNPPSQTQHDVTNVEIVSVNDDEIVVFCNLAVHELRNGDGLQVGLGEIHTYHARCRYRLARKGGELLITEKRCLLLNRLRPLYNLTFVF